METANQSDQLQSNQLNKLIDETGTIVFDTASGISLEEQQEILAGINAIAGENRLTPDVSVIEAKKKGFLFPLFVNIGALVLLILGFIILGHLHNNDEQEIRESRSVLGLTERMLIQEIRQDTERQIREKEIQISDVFLRLQAVDAEYKDLQVSVENMTAAQKQRATSLLVLSEEYQRMLLGLNEEKARILEDSRQREADLWAQAGEKAKALSSGREQDWPELDAAMEELKKLSTEQERINRAEREMNGFYATLNSQIESGRLDEARATINSAREFLDAPSLRGIRVFETRKQTHLAAIDAMEKAIASSSGGVVIQDTAQEETIAELMARAAAQERLLAAFTAEGADQNKVIAEYTAALSQLESSNAEQKDALNNKDSEIQTLRNEIAQREQRMTDLNSSMAVLQAQYDDLQRRMEAAIRAFNGE
jgi:chromosome segregation ATPase